MKVLLALVALTLVTACSTTQNTTQSTQKSEELELAQVGGNESVDEDKQVYCTREAMIGTRLPQRRICRTKEEWRTITETSKESLEELQRLPTAVIGN